MTARKGLDSAYEPALTFAAVGSIPLTFIDDIASSTYSNETNPMAFSLVETVVLTSPFPLDIIASFTSSSSLYSTPSSNAVLVPEPASLETTTIGALLPPTSLQLVIFL